MKEKENKILDTITFGLLLLSLVSEISALWWFEYEYKSNLLIIHIEQILPFILGIVSGGFIGWYIIKRGAETKNKFLFLLMGLGALLGIFGYSVIYLVLRVSTHPSYLLSTCAGVFAFVGTVNGIFWSKRTDRQISIDIRLINAICLALIMLSEALLIAYIFLERYRVSLYWPFRTEVFTFLITGGVIPLIFSIFAGIAIGWYINNRVLRMLNQRKSLELSLKTSNIELGLEATYRSFFAGRKLVIVGGSLFFIGFIIMFLSFLFFDIDDSSFLWISIVSNLIALASFTLFFIFNTKRSDMVYFIIYSLLILGFTMQILAVSPNPTVNRPEFIFPFVFAIIAGVGIGWYIRKRNLEPENKFWFLLVGSGGFLGMGFSLIRLIFHQFSYDILSYDILIVGATILIFACITTVCVYNLKPFIRIISFIILALSFFVLLIEHYTQYLTFFYEWRPGYVNIHSYSPSIPEIVIPFAAGIIAAYGIGSAIRDRRSLGFRGNKINIVIRVISVICGGILILTIFISVAALFNLGNFSGFLKLLPGSAYSFVALVAFVLILIFQVMNRELSPYVPDNIGLNQTILAVSDLHLGYKSKDHMPNKELFKKFLNSLVKIKTQQQDSSPFQCDRLILIGDIFDFWVRDDAGNMLENHDIIASLLDQKEKGISVDFIVGNHDYSLSTLRNKVDDVVKYQYPSFTASKKDESPFHDTALVFVDKQDETKDDEIQYWFIHGDEFDPIQAVDLFNILASTHDELGGFLAALYNNIKGLLGVRKDYSKSFGIKTLLLSSWKRQILLEPGVKDETIRGIIEENVERFAIDPGHSDYLAYDDETKKKLNLDSKKGKSNVFRIFVYGHTHKPEIDKKNMANNYIIANAGGWVYPALEGDERDTCTFLKIDKLKDVKEGVKKGNIALYRWIGENTSEWEVKDSISFHIDFSSGVPYFVRIEDPKVTAAQPHVEVDNGRITIIATASGWKSPKEDKVEWSWEKCGREDNSKKWQSMQPSKLPPQYESEKVFKASWPINGLENGRYRIGVRMRRSDKAEEVVEHIICISIGSKALSEKS
ncbi:MAG: hypothetical protein ACFFC7_32020 [Candidatus Hermodarchaeota archaeon]